MFNKVSPVQEKIIERSKRDPVNDRIKGMLKLLNSGTHRFYMDEHGTGIIEKNSPLPCVNETQFRATTDYMSTAGPSEFKSPKYSEV